MSIIIFFVVLFVLILVHEWGHFITAKKTGMRVDEFGIGFPPRAASWKWGETVYSLNWLPIGGFVKIWGENFGVDDDSESVDRSRAFGSKSKWAQALVLIAGVTMNILFAWLLFTIIFLVGVPTEVSEEQATDAATLTIINTLPDSPAAVLPRGGSIVGVKRGDDELTALTPTAFGSFVGGTDEPIRVTYEFNGQTATAELTPTAGLLADEPGRTLIGAQTALIETQRTGPIDAVIKGFRRTYNGVIAVTVGLVTFIGQAVTGTADYSQVAGPVGIVGLVGDAAAIGFVTLLSFTAFISLNLAVINMLPIPALDGGRLLFVAIEAVTGKDIPPQWAGYLNAIGMGLLLLLMVVVTFNDVLRLL